MSYPEPFEGQTPEELYKQAMFLYREYERVKKENEGLRQELKITKQKLSDKIDYIHLLETGEEGREY
jgi:hypothetical protein